MRRDVILGLGTAAGTATALAAVSFIGGVDCTTLGFGIGVACALGGVFLLIGSLFDASPWWVRRSSALLLSAGVVASANPWFTHEIRLAAFARAARNAKPLVYAIHEFEVAHRRPPRSLAELTPKYLSSVPATGLWLHPAFSYSSNQHVWHLEVTLSMDSFFYDPKQSHPEGGAKRRFGDWVYAFW